MEAIVGGGCAGCACGALEATAGNLCARTIPAKTGTTNSRAIRVRFIRVTLLKLLELDKRLCRQRIRVPAYRRRYQAAVTMAGISNPVRWAEQQNSGFDTNSAVAKVLDLTDPGEPDYL